MWAHSLTPHPMRTPDSPGPWDDAEAIASYTRAEAIEDGALIDVSEMAEEAGFRVPVAVTSSVAALLTPSKSDAERGQSFRGRLWDTLMLLRASAREGDTLVFDVLIATGSEVAPAKLMAVISPGDAAEPVITIMLPDED